MYLLLRNNKQSGPYSLEELKSMGLKAYDLVWLDGKSAAWRYPCEIEELKSFAPPVEEQPFDRFYKKTPASVTGNTATASTGTSTAPGPVPVTVESTRNPGKRIIYVTMPAARNTSTPATSREPIRESARPASAIVQPAQVIAPPAEVVAESSSVTAQPSSSAGVKPAPEMQSAPNVGSAPAVSTWQPARGDRQIPGGVQQIPGRGRRVGSTARPMRLLLVGSCILALLAAGIFIGLHLNKDHLGFNKDELSSGGRVVARIPPSTGQPDIHDPHASAQTLPASAATSPAANSDGSRKNDSAAAGNQPPLSNGSAVAPAVGSQPAEGKIVSRQPAAKTQKDKPTHSINPMNGLPPTKDSAAGRSDVTRAVHPTEVIETRSKMNGTSSENPATPPEKEAVKTALASQVSVGANGYSVGTFGGINDLQLTVTNRSVYPLDLVIVEVQYIQANKKVFKTENLYFHSVGAGSALMLEAPRSSRGVKVQYRITAISSKELGLSYSGI